MSRDHLSIRLNAASASGRTELSAFDAALRRTGCGNYNLVRLSSVIPPDAELVLETEVDEPAAEWGDRLYCVYAAQTAARPGRQAWAGVGWVRVADSDGRGLFAEHEGGSEDEVRSLIAASLHDMCADRPEEFTAPESQVIGTECDGYAAVCALVVAKYQVQAWRRTPRPELPGAASIPALPVAVGMGAA